MADQKKQQKQFVLVHGSNHGAWCWYKVKPLLEAAGHHVTVLDLTAAGINITPVQEVYTLYEYTKPLLEILASLPPDEKVILVGHSFGGLSLALASDMFPQKIFVAVFLTAFMPDTTHQPSYVMDKLREMAPNQTQLDAQFEPYDSSDPDSPLSILIGPKMLANNLYQLSPVEDLELAKVLVRPGPLLPHELSKAKPFSKKGYGSVSKVYIVCGEDKCMLKEFQYWMIENIHVDHVMEIPNADHMPMFSTTQELFERLSDVSTLYA